MQVRTTVDVEVAAAKVIDSLASEIFSTATSNGFWEDDDDLLTIPLKLALISAEVSEALEVHREKYPCDCVIARGVLSTCTCDEPDITMSVQQVEDFGYELADIIIRVLDLAWGYAIPIGELVTSKVEKNKDRPFKHNKRY